MNTENKQAPVEVKDLHKSFGPQNVLDGIDLTVRPGETVALLGRSGTGKSVFLKLLIGLQHPDAGSIRVYGQEIAGLEMDPLNEIRTKVGFLFQQAALYDSLTVEENVAFPLIRHTQLSPAERRERTRKLLESVGMEKDLEKMPSEISGGMQKRVGLARALALDPSLLLFDEPTAGPDPITTQEIGELILRLKDEKHITCIVVTHDIRGIKNLSDRFVLLHEGKLVIEGKYETLRKSRDPFVVRFLSEAA